MKFLRAYKLKEPGFGLLTLFVSMLIGLAIVIGWHSDMPFMDPDRPWRQNFDRSHKESAVGILVLLFWVLPVGLVFGLPIITWLERTGRTKTPLPIMVGASALAVVSGLFCGLGDPMLAYTLPFGCVFGVFFWLLYLGPFASKQAFMDAFKNVKR